MLAGWHGRYLRIDPRPGRTACVPLDESVLRDFIGGVGLGTWIVAHETPAGTDPLGAEAALVFALSPLVGSPLTTSAKFAVVALSPLTGRLCDALASSHFAIAAKRVGIDALVVRGACAAPTVVFVDGTGPGPPRVEWRPAGPLWGLSARAAEDRIRAEHGRDWQVAAIGPAGRAPDPVRHAQPRRPPRRPGGLGAVLGAKQIKAVAVRGDRRTPLADPAATVALARALFGPLVRPGHREVPRARNRRQPVDLQPPRHPADPQLPLGPLRGGRAAGHRRPRPGATDRPDVVRGVHHRLRAHLRPPNGPRANMAAGSDSNTSRSSPWARSAATPTPPWSWRRPMPATSSASTRSAPAERSLS